jgi:hypothetical protein
MKRETMKRIAVFGAALFLAAGCTTQGRLTYLKFEESNNYSELNASMQLLKYEAYDGSVQQQMSALKEARWISKYMEEEGKREMALRAIAFMAFGSEDGDVRERSLSRLESILSGPDWVGGLLGEEPWPLHLRLAAVNGVIDVATGELGFEELVDDRPMRFGVGTSQRTDAIEFLLDHWEEWDFTLQYEGALGLGRILRTLPTLDRCPADVCDESIRKGFEKWGNMAMDNCPDSVCSESVRGKADEFLGNDEEPEEKQEWREESEELKEEVWAELRDILKNNDLPLLVRTEIALLAGETHLFGIRSELQERFDQVAQDEWLNDESIPSDLRQLIAAVQERQQLYGYPAAQDPVPSSGELTNLAGQTPSFLALHLDAVLREQTRIQETGQVANDPNLAEAVFSAFDPSEEGMLRQGLLQGQVRRNLAQGFRLEDPRLSQMVSDSLNQLERLSEETDRPELARLSLTRQLQMLEQIWPSLKAQGASTGPLLKNLVDRAEATLDLDLRRAYLRVVLAAHSMEPNQVQPLVEGLTSLDVVTRHQIDSVIHPVSDGPLPETEPAPEAFSEETPEA